MKQPATSTAAYRSLKPDILRTEYHRIIEAIKELGKANYEQIAAKSKIDRTEVGRRLSEMVKRGLIIRLSSTSMLSTGRQGYEYTLPLIDTPKVDKIESEKPTISPMPTLF